MGSCCCKKIYIVKNYVKKDQNLDFHVLNGKITISYDENFEVPMAKIDCKGNYNSFVRKWPIRDDHFSLSSNSVQGIDTVF